MRVASVKVHELCEQIRGVSYDKSEPVSQATAGYLPLLRANNITDRGLVFDELIFVPEKRVDPKQRLQLHDVVIATSSGSRDVVGKAADVRTELCGTFGAFCKVLRPNQKVHPGYFAHFFKTPYYRRIISALAGGANINNLRNEHLNNLVVPLPSLADQQRISNVLDKAERLRTSRQAALAHLDTLVQAVFEELFGNHVNSSDWPKLRLDDLGEVQGGLSLSEGRRRLPIRIPYLRVANVYRGFLDMSGVKTLQATEAEIARTKLEPKDLLIVEGHGNPNEIGRCALWDGSIEPCVHQNHLIRVRVDQKCLDPVFACEFLNSPSGRQHLLRAGKTTTGLNTISLSAVRETPVLVPPIALQQEFARRVAAIEEHKATQRASLAELDALFASLQDRAFRGEL